MRCAASSEVTHSLLTAYSRLVNRRLPKASPSVPFSNAYTNIQHHRCTRDCNFLVSQPDTWICVATGNFHHCTEDTCDRQIVSPDSSSCELTARSYALDLNFHFDSLGQGKSHQMADDDNDDDDGDARAHHDHQHSPKRAKESHEVHDQELHDGGDMYTDIHAHEQKPSPSPSSSSPPSANKKKRGRKRKMDLPENGEEASVECTQRKLTFETTLLNVLKSTDRNSVLVQTIVKNCEHLWVSIVRSGLLHEYKHQYSEEYHVLSVLDYMKKGLMPKGHLIIAQNEFVRAHMPAIHDTRFQVPRFTKTVKFFYLCMLKIMETSGDVHGLHWIQ
jgi:hypothetical protein